MTSEITFSQNFKRRMIALAIMIGFVILITMPATYLTLSIIDKRSLATIHSKDISSKLAESIRENPQMWMYNAQKVAQIQSFYRGKDIATLNLYDGNHSLIQKVDLLRPPYMEITGSWPIKYNNRIYGFVEVVEDTNSIIQVAALILIAFSFLGSISAFVIYRFPTRMVVRAENEVLQTYYRLKHVEYELRDREAALRRITDNMLDIICQITFEGIVQYVTPSSTHILGYEPEKLLGKCLYDFIHDDDKHKIMTDTKKLKISDSTKKMEFRMNHSNGEYLWIESLTSLLRNEDDIAQGIIFCIRDVTERKYLQQEVVRLDRLHLIGEMAAGIGHEIRNPMTTVRGFLQILSAKKENLCYQDHYNLMIEELDRVNSIIKEYLNLAKDKAINLEVQNLNSVINKIYPLILADAMLTDKGVLLDLSTIPDLPIDEKEIRQLILNLTRNGLEAMEPGGCLVIKTIVECNNVVVLSVRDQGKGIDSMVLEKLGTPFITTKENGTGLGLAVCYSIADRQNAKIEVSSGSTGSTFYVKFFSLASNSRKESLDIISDTYNNIAG